MKSNLWLIALNLKVKIQPQFFRLISNFSLKQSFLLTPAPAAYQIASLTQTE